jgi:transcriptional regulator with XRE-family HTH domain
MTRTEWLHVFGDNLVELIEEAGMSQSQLARESGLSVSRINDYVNKNATPSVFAIINMAYALDVSVSELVDFGEEIE